MLGKLAKLLRIMGFDTLYSNRIDFKELLMIATEEKRLILTRNTIIDRQKRENRFLFIKDNDPKRQLEEVITGLGLKADPARAFTRCILCNYELQEIRREDVEKRVPDYIFETHRDFSFCERCGRIFWKGTHHENVLALYKGYFKS